MSNLPDTGVVKAFVFSECKRWNRCYRVSRNEQKKGIMVFVCSSASKYDKQSKCPFKMTFKRHKTMNLWNIVEKSSHYAHACDIADGKRRQFNTKDLVSVDKKVSEVLSTYVPVSNRLSGKNNGGNNSQLRQIIKSSSGLKVKGHQVHEILSKMQSQTSEQLIQQSFLVRSLLKKLQEVDKNGTYVLESKKVGYQLPTLLFWNWTILTKT